jgi:hypothetical protein
MIYPIYPLLTQRPPLVGIENKKLFAFIPRVLMLIIACYEGDLERLKILAQAEISLVASLDTAQRTPLFYGVAYNHPSVVEYILGMSHSKLSECNFRSLTL